MKKNLLIAILCFHATGLFSFDGFMGEDPFAAFSDGGMDDFFSKSGNADFDFGNMDFGSESDDPFASLFGSGYGDDSESSSEQTGGKSKKPVEPPVAASAEEAFKNGVAAEIKKLTPQYKEAIAFYLNEISSQLHALVTHSSSFVLGIKRKRELAPSTAIAEEAVQAIDAIKTNSLYHIALLSKEFEGLRVNIMAASNTIENLNAEFSALAATMPDSLDTPSSKEITQQKKLFRKAKSTTTKIIKPLIADLKKVIAHKSIKDRLAVKKKKYAPKVGGSRAGASGGWGSGAGRYFNDDYGYGGSGGGWGDWGGGSGGGYSWDDGWSGGGYGGGYGNDYDQSDYRKSSSSRSSSPSTSNSSAVRQPSRSFYGYDDEDDYQVSGRQNYTTRPTSFIPVSENFADLEPREQMRTILRLLPKNLEQWQRRYEAATTKPLKNAAVKTMLEDVSFTADAERLVKVIKLYKDLEATLDELLKEEYQKLYTVLPSYIPLLVHAVAYASPPLSELFEEKETLRIKKLSPEKAKEVAERNQRQRRWSYKMLIELLGFVRNSRKQHAKIFYLVVDELLKHARVILGKLEYFSKSLETGSVFSLETTMKLSALSRQLYHEPVVVGYAVLDEKNSDKEGQRQERLDIVRAEKERVTALVAPIVEQQYELLHAIITIMQEAVESVRVDLNIEDGARLSLDDSDCTQKLSAKISDIINTTYGDHPQRNAINAVLIPYDQQKYQHLEVQHGLLVELMKMWSQKELPTEVAAVDKDYSLSQNFSDEDLPFTTTSLDGDDSGPVESLLEAKRPVISVQPSIGKLSDDGLGDAEEEFNEAALMHEFKQMTAAQGTA
ncbi:MAG: hypothetical protein QG604_97 [Candidatus Dependentiae bacterium]|nr:hypothetical protein [Candidatus Dependentiae bacterium]